MNTNDDQINKQQQQSHLENMNVNQSAIDTSNVFPLK